MPHRQYNVHLNPHDLAAFSTIMETAAIFDDKLLLPEARAIAGNLRELIGARFTSTYAVLNRMSRQEVGFLWDHWNHRDITINHALEFLAKQGIVTALFSVTDEHAKITAVPDNAEAARQKFGLDAEDMETLKMFVENIHAWMQLSPKVEKPVSRSK